MEKFVLQGSPGGPYPHPHIPVWVTANPGGSSAFWSGFAVWRLQTRLSQLPKLNPRGNARWGNAAPGWVLGTMQNPQAQGEVCHRQLDPFLTLGISFTAGISGALWWPFAFVWLQMGEAITLCCVFKPKLQCSHQIIKILRNMGFSWSMDNRKCFQAGFLQPSCFDIGNVLTQSNREIAVINCCVYRNWTIIMCYWYCFGQNPCGGLCLKNPFLWSFCELFSHKVMKSVFIPGQFFSLQQRKDWSEEKY